jgi:hypothetical protein
MAPTAVQRTSLEEYRRSYSGAVMNGESPDLEDNTRYVISFHVHPAPAHLSLLNSH